MSLKDAYLVFLCIDRDVESVLATILHSLHTATIVISWAISPKTVPCNMSQGTGVGSAAVITVGDGHGQSKGHSAAPNSNGCGWGYGW